MLGNPGQPKHSMAMWAVWFWLQICDDPCTNMCLLWTSPWNLFLMLGVTSYVQFCVGSWLQGNALIVWFSLYQFTCCHT